MTKAELRITELLTELHARFDQMSVQVAKVEGLEAQLAAANETRLAATREADRQEDLKYMPRLSSRNGDSIKYMPNNRPTPHWIS